MDSYYSSLSGMLAASLGLQNTANNVANMQNFGFKRSDLFYSCLSHDNQFDQGVKVGGKTINFGQAQCLPTNGPTDLAIVGSGFFVVGLEMGQLSYTRSGQFEFNAQGMLADKHSKGLVKGLNDQGQLVNIHQKDSQISAGKATHMVDLSGNFVAVERVVDPNEPPNPDPFKSKYDPIRFTVNDIFDNQGKKHTLSLEFESPGMPGNGSSSMDMLRWELKQAVWDTNEITHEPQTIVFDSETDGNAVEGNNKINLIIDNQSISLNFGDYSTDKNKAVHLKKKASDNSSSDINVIQHDGYAQGQPIGFSFNEEGQIVHHYDNGQTNKGAHLALASFDMPNQRLKAVNGNCFIAIDDKGRTLGHANQQGLGAIQSGNLEASNVDSTMEFANIVVLQRMFQGCSQIMQLDKQLLEEFNRK